MLIKRQSIKSGVLREFDLPITEDQFERYCAGELIQKCFTDCTASQREFFITGMTDEEFDSLYSEEEDDPDDKGKETDFTDHLEEDFQ